MGTMASSGSPVSVRVSALRVTRGKARVLHDLTLDLRPGQITGLLGPSGSGKTTLMRSIVGVQRIESGSVTVLDHPAGAPQLRRRVAYGTQGSAVYHDLTVRQNLVYAASLYGVKRDVADRISAEVGLTGHAHRLAGALSGGELSRVSLAVALIGSPDVLVLDEPTVGLDPVLRHELWEMFRGLAARGATLLVSSHVMDEAQRCDVLLLMREGRLIAETTPAALLNETGTTDMEAAFLKLIAQENAPHRGRHSDEEGRV